MVSIIIPILNEEKVLTEKADHFKNLSKRAEIIFADGGSSDKSRRIAGRYGEVISAKKGRAAQMNRGARSSTSDILLFLHADTVVSWGALESIEETMRGKGIVGGCLTQRIAKEGVIYRFIESFGNIRARVTKIFYGDQGIFINKGAFFNLKGFPEVPVMEDVLLSRRLRRFGKTAVMPDIISTSPRRWEKRGALRTIFFYSSLNLLFWLRFPLKKIKLLCDDLR